MLSAAFMAWKAASPLIKYGAIAGIIALAIGWYVAQRAYHEWQGRLQAEAAQERELRQQSQASAQEYAKQVTSLRQQVEEVQRERDAYHEQLSTAHQEIQRYAKLNQVRRIDNDAIAIVNEFARVLNTATDERVPDAGGAAGEPPVAAKEAPTTLDAFDRLEVLTAGWGECELKHRGLSEWAVEKHRSEVEFFTKDSPP
jgi:hypothetical protein